MTITQTSSELISEHAKPLCVTGNSTSEEATEVSTSRELETQNPRPWVRYWARMLDVYLFAIVLGLTLGIFVPEILDTVNDYVFGVIIIVSWVFVESTLLVVCGTTPGKAFFKVRLRKSDGSDISISDALSRSVHVSGEGMGAGIPIASLITLCLSYNEIQAEGQTPWDRNTGFRVVHEKIGWIRVSLIILFFSLFFGLVLLASDM